MAGNGKQSRSSGSWNKVSKVHAPGRGYIVDPLRGDDGGISPGKRLCVEHVNAGREGGVFSLSGYGNSETVRLSQGYK